MTRRLDSMRKAPPAARAGKRSPNGIPAVLPKPLQPYAAPEGASVFKVAMTEATAEHVCRTQDVTGPFDRDTLVAFYLETQNPLWLLASISISRKLEDLSPEVYTYLHAVAKKVFEGTIERVSSLDRLRIVPGKELEEGIVRQSKAGPCPPDILDILELSHPGRNLFQAAAGNLRDFSYAAAVQTLAREKGCSLDQAHVDLAKASGRTSAETGLSTASVKQFATRGKKIIDRRASQIQK